MYGAGAGAAGAGTFCQEPEPEPERPGHFTRSYFTQIRRMCAFGETSPWWCTMRVVCAVLLAVGNHHLRCHAGSVHENVLRISVFSWWFSGFSQRLSPCLGHQRSADFFGGLLRQGLGQASGSRSEQKQNEADPLRFFSAPDTLPDMLEAPSKQCPLSFSVPYMVRTKASFNASYNWAAVEPGSSYRPRKDSFTTNSWVAYRTQMLNCPFVDRSVVPSAITP